MKSWSELKKIVNDMTDMELIILKDLIKMNEEEEQVDCFECGATWKHDCQC